VLAHFTARGFRNLLPLDIAPAPGTHLLLGGNGAGKTSLLEAVYVLATTRSFRAAQIADCAAHGTGEMEVWGEVETDRRTALAVSVREGGAPAQRQRQADAPVRASGSAAGGGLVGVGARGC